MLNIFSVPVEFKHYLKLDNVTLPWSDTFYGGSKLTGTKY